MRELKQIVNGMRKELREHLANGNGTRAGSAGATGVSPVARPPAPLNQQTYRPLFSVDNQREANKLRRSHSVAATTPAGTFRGMFSRGMWEEVGGKSPERADACSR